MSIEIFSPAYHSIFLTRSCADLKSFIWMSSNSLILPVKVHALVLKLKWLHDFSMCVFYACMFHMKAEVTVFWRNLIKKIRTGGLSS